MSQWIKVEDKLPEVEKDVLLFDPGSCQRIFLGYIECEGAGKFWRVDGFSNCYLGDFTHWMPLPEPPKEEE